jgi:hypothetical protein
MQMASEFAVNSVYEQAFVVSTLVLQVSEPCSQLEPSLVVIPRKLVFSFLGNVRVGHMQGRKELRDIPAANVWDVAASLGERRAKVISPIQTDSELELTG